MKTERNKIIEATEAELMEHYLKEGYDDIYSFREYLRLMVEAGVKILEEEDEKGKWENVPLIDQTSILKLKK